MAKPANVIRPRKLTIHLPEDQATRLDLYLWSESQQRVPHGAYQAFFIDRIKEFFDRIKEG